MKALVAYFSGSGIGIGKTAEKLKPYVPGAEVVEAKLLHSADEARAWVK